MFHIRPGTHAMLRGFTDSLGTEWRVWEVFPTANATPSSADTFSQSSLKGTAYAEGWLCFESASEKRRLAPIPIGWEHRELALLQELLAAATPVKLSRRG